MSGRAVRRKIAERQAWFARAQAIRAQGGWPMRLTRTIGKVYVNGPAFRKFFATADFAAWAAEFRRTHPSCRGKRGFW